MLDWFINISVLVHQVYSFQSIFTFCSIIYWHFFLIKCCNLSGGSWIYFSLMFTRSSLPNNDLTNSWIWIALKKFPSSKCFVPNKRMNNLLVQIQVKYCTTDQTISKMLSCVSFCFLLPCVVIEQNSIPLLTSVMRFSTKYLWTWWSCSTVKSALNVSLHSNNSKWIKTQRYHYRNNVGFLSGSSAFRHFMSSIHHFLRWTLSCAFTSKFIHN